MSLLITGREGGEPTERERETEKESHVIMIHANVTHKCNHGYKTHAGTCMYSTCAINCSIVNSNIMMLWHPHCHWH